MRQRVVVILPIFQSPRTAESIPSTRAALGQLRSQFEVECLLWPHLRGSPATDMTWEGVRNQLREFLTPGCHLLALGGQAAAAIMALDRDRTGVSSFFCDGLFAPPATLRAFGLDSQATFAEAMLRITRASVQEMARMVLPESSEDDSAALGRLLIDDIDWDRLGALTASFAALDMLSEGPLVTTPTLCLQPDLPLIGLGETMALLRSFVPDAEIEEAGPVNLASAEFALSFARSASDFINRHS